jgi:hypothetical protein
MSVKYANLAKDYMSSGNTGSHVDELADEIVKNHPHIKDSTDVIAKKLSATFSSSIKRKKGEFLRVKNKQGGFKRGVYKLSKKLTQQPAAPIRPTGISTGFVGKGGEHAVLSALLFEGYNASIMTVDDGIDIVASKETKYFHIQVKAATEKNNSFQFTIQKSSFNRHNNNKTFYILLCRRYLKTHTQNDLIILPNATINHYISAGTIKNGPSLNLNVSIEKSKYTLNKSGIRKSDITSYVNDFTHLR